MLLTGEDTMVFRLNNGRYLKYIDEKDENLNILSELLENNHLLIVGEMGEKLYKQYEDLKNNTTVMELFLTSGHNDIYLIEKSPKLLKEYSQITKDTLALFPRVDGKMFSLKIKKELGVKQSSKEIAGVLLNYIYSTIAGDTKYNVQGMEATAILYKLSKEEVKKYF